MQKGKKVTNGSVFYGMRLVACWRKVRKARSSRSKGDRRSWKTVGGPCACDSRNIISISALVVVPLTKQALGERRKEFGHFLSEEEITWVLCALILISKNMPATRHV